MAKTKVAKKKTDAKRVDYAKNWDACEKCGRRIARMENHMKQHRTGQIDAKGFRTDRQNNRKAAGAKKPKAKAKKASKPRAKKAKESANGGIKSTESQLVEA